MYYPEPNEEMFEIKPIGIRYRCEICKVGEMKVDTKNPDVDNNFNPPLIKHVCISCDNILYIHKQYPYIEWVRADEF
jgi:hypothetical protein